MRLWYGSSMPNVEAIVKKWHFSTILFYASYIFVLERTFVEHGLSSRKLNNSSVSQNGLLLEPVPRRTTDPQCNWRHSQVKKLTISHFEFNGSATEGKAFICFIPFTQHVSLANHVVRFIMSPLLKSVYLIRRNNIISFYILDPLQALQGPSLHYLWQ